MTSIQILYQRTSKLEEWVILAYALAVYLPITIAWVVLIAGIVIFVARALLETVLVHQGKLEQSVMGTAGGSWLQAFSSSPTVRSIKQAPLAMPLFIFALVALISGAFNGGAKEALSSLSTLRAFLVYFIAYQAFSCSDGLLRKALTVLLSCGAIAGVWGAIQQLFHFHPFEDFQYLQASGFMGNPMAYAGQMEIVACLALAVLLSGAYKTMFGGNQILFILITACNIAGIFFASERSAWLGMLFGVLSISCLLSFRMFYRMVLALIVASGIAWFAVPVVQTRIVPLLTNPMADVSVRVRLVVWQKALDVWREHPIVGVGVRNFPKLDIPEAIVPGESTFLVHAHSNVLHVLATMGAMGFAAFVYMQLTMLITAYKDWCRSATPDDDEQLLRRAIGLGALGGIVSIMVAGFFEYNFGTGHVRLMHWFVLGMLMSDVSLRPGKTLESPGSEQAHDGARD